MSENIFDLALEKRFTDSPEAVVVDITASDTLLIRNQETGVLMRLPFSVLANAVSGALTGYLKSANNLSDVENAGTARTNLGATTLGSNLFTVPNPGAVRFPRFNADNTVSPLTASDFRTAIGAGTSSTTGTVTSVGVSVPTGLSVSGSPVTSSGTIAISYAAGYSIPSNTAQSAWSAKEPGITTGTTAQYWRGDKSWQTLNKAAVGLSNVDNTSDANKPVSTAQQTALDAKAPKDAPEFTGIVKLAGAVLRSEKSIVISARDTYVSLPNTEAVAGVLHLRDNTLGGSAVFFCDPNAGIQGIGTNQIAGLAYIRYDSGLGYVLQIRLASGTVPRTIKYAMLGGQ